MIGSRRVYWSQGLFLTPQHLQKQDIYHEARAFDFWQAGREYFWGVKRLMFANGAFAGARADILHLEAITQDGLTLRGGREEANANLEMQPRDLRQLLEGRTPGETVHLFLAVADFQASGSNIDDLDTQPGAPARRFVVLPKLQPDLYHPDDHEAAELEEILWQGVLWTDGDEGFHAAQETSRMIPLAKLRVAREGFELVSDYVPPSIRIDAAWPCRAILQDCADRVIQRAREYARDMRDRGIQSASGASQDIVRMVILSALNRVALQIRLVAEAGDSHPAQGYAAIRWSIAELASYSSEYDLLGGTVEEDETKELPSYSHQKIGENMRRAESVLIRLLNALSVGPEMMIELEWSEEARYFQADLPREFFDGRAKQYWLIIENPDLTGEVVRENINQTGKLGDPHGLHHLIANNLTAVPLIWEQFPPETLPRRARRYFYFRADLTGHGAEQWRAVEESQQIALYAPELDTEYTKIFIAKTSAEK